jgi:hypothetical protein
MLDAPSQQDLSRAFVMRPGHSVQNEIIESHTACEGGPCLVERFGLLSAPLDGNTYSRSCTHLEHDPVLPTNVDDRLPSHPWMQVDLIKDRLFEAPLLELLDMFGTKVGHSNRLDPASPLGLDTSFPAWKKRKSMNICSQKQDCRCYPHAFLTFGPPMGECKR